MVEYLLMVTLSIYLLSSNRTTYTVTYFFRLIRFMKKEWHVSPLSIFGICYYMSSLSCMMAFYLMMRGLPALCLIQHRATAHSWLKQRPMCAADNFPHNSTSLQAAIGKHAAAMGEHAAISKLYAKVRLFRWLNLFTMVLYMESK